MRCAARWAWAVWRLFRQVLTESLLLAVAGGVFGVGLAFGVVKLFKVIGGTCHPAAGCGDQRVGRCWPAGLGAAMFAAVLAGAVPALASLAVGSDGGAEERRAEGQRWGGANGGCCAESRWLQTALTLALLVGAGLLIRTMINYRKRARRDTTRGGYLTMSVTDGAGRSMGISTGARWSVLRRFPACSMRRLPGECR